jgi:excinuclease ABC subunit A
VKLSRELAKPGTGSTLYILDEPTTGLHFTDIEKLLTVLERLVDAGNTVLVVEHNLEVIQAADWVIDMGPEAGAGGGKLVVEGPPEDLVVHAARWRQEQDRRASAAGPAEPLLRSHTGEALDAFVEPPASRPPSSGSGVTSGPRVRSTHRAGTRSPTC